MLISSSAELFRLRKFYLTVQATLLLILAIFAFVPIFLNFNETGTLSPTGVIGVSITLGLSVLWLYLLRTNRVTAAAYGLLVTALGAFLFLSSAASILTGTLTLITAALLLRRPYFYTITAVVFLRMIVELGTLVRAPVYDYSTVLTLLLNGMTFALVGTVARSIIMATIRTVENSSRIASAMQGATDIGRTITQQADVQEMMRLTINFIRDKYGFYHAQVFILNESGDQAVLRASTGDIGYQLLARRHQLTVGSQSVVGQAVLRGTPVLVTDTGREAVYFRNELLPNTRAEFTIPLKDGGKSFGALDVQSTSAESFTEIDRRALEVIGDLLALSLREARIVQEQTRTAEENVRLAREALALQRENERLSRELTQSTWNDYLSQRSTITGVDFEGGLLTAADSWSLDMTNARKGETVTHKGKGRVAVPVILRGEIIGAIEVDAGQSTAAETVEIAQAVAQRLAVSLESARLYEETRLAAYQEQQINEIAASFGTTASIDELLRITLAELGETLGAQGGAIRLGRLDNGASQS